MAEHYFNIQKVFLPFLCFKKRVLNNETIVILKLYSCILFCKGTKNGGEKKKRETDILSALCVGRKERKKKEKNQAIGGC
jgi:hypothetical protein